MFSYSHTAKNRKILLRKQVLDRKWHDILLIWVKQQIYDVLKKKTWSLRVPSSKGFRYFSCPGAKVPMHKEVFSHFGEANTRKALMVSGLCGRADFRLQLCSQQNREETLKVLWGLRIHGMKIIQHSNLSQAYHHNYLAYNSTDFSFIEKLWAFQVSKYRTGIFSSSYLAFLNTSSLKCFAALGFNKFFFKITSKQLTKSSEKQWEISLLSLYQQHWTEQYLLEGGDGNHRLLSKLTSPSIKFKPVRKHSSLLYPVLKWMS